MSEETSSNNSVGSSLSNKGVDVTAILSKTSDHSIKTRNGAIRNSTDLNSWLTKHDKSNELFRYHVDFHAMMEHIFHSEASMDSLELMEKCHKARLRTVGEAITVSSYDHRIPLLLNSIDMKSSPLMETDTNASCFDAIQSPDEFDGFKQSFRQSLFEFGKNHQRMVDTCYAQGSDLHRIASESLTESISFAEGLMQYMGKTYKVYSAPNGLEENHAWHLTTALARRLIEFVGEPRLYVTSGIMVGDLADINRRITMASFRSLDKMKKVKSLNFENVPCVHVELSRFFFKIVSPEAIETLQATAEELKEDLAEMNQMSNSREAAELLHQQIQMKNQIDALVGGVATMKRYITEGSFNAEMPTVKGSKLRSQFLCIYRWQIATTRRNGRSSSFDTQDIDLRGMD
ncbi:hypothetical protein IV203_005292 [Nitzschia inconspicua]|uniref:Uncharacterized protein n=1 Tax=Nitzschia inconspicua TaxID=303405 RepID=A0A9K3KN67_9STRA|nr:hypothetical protein IV203_005292 [Nitzschia inconspicua]